MRRILSFGNAEIALIREESDGSCLGCFFNEKGGECVRYPKYHTTAFSCDETYDSGEVDEDGEEITYTDYWIWRRDKVLDKCTIVI